MAIEILDRAWITFYSQRDNEQKYYDWIYKSSYTSADQG